MAKERPILDSGLEVNGQSQDPASLVMPELTDDKDLLGPNSVEVRFGDPEVVAPQLLELYTDPTIIEHLENTTPPPRREDYRTNREYERAYRLRLEEIREWFRNPTVVLLTAETSSGLVIASSIVGKMSDDRAEISKVVVRPGYRGPKIVDKETGQKSWVVDEVIKAGNAFIFNKDGLDCRFAEAFVIVGTRDEDRPGFFEPMPFSQNALNAFRRQGYDAGPDRTGATRSWSNELGRIVAGRVSQSVTLTREKYRYVYPGDHEKYFPQQRLSKAA